MWPCVCCFILFFVFSKLRKRFLHGENYSFLHTKKVKVFTFISFLQDKKMGLNFLVKKGLFFILPSHTLIPPPVLRSLGSGGMDLIRKTGEDGFFIKVDEPVD